MVHTCNPVRRRLRQEDYISDQSGQDTHTNTPSQKKKEERKEGKGKEGGQEGGKAWHGSLDRNTDRKDPSLPENREQGLGQFSEGI